MFRIKIVHNIQNWINVRVWRTWSLWRNNDVAISVVQCLINFSRAFNHRSRRPEDHLFFPRLFFCSPSLLILFYGPEQRQRQPCVYSHLITYFLRMFLYQKGTGLLETHVTWEDVEEELAKALGIPCKMGPNRTATLIGEGEVCWIFFFFSS